MMFLSPPCWDCYSPFSAVPCLVGKLRQEGFAVDQYDLGIYYIHYLLSKKWRGVADWCLSQAFYEQEIELYAKNCYGSYLEFKNDMWFLRGGQFDIDAVKLAYEEMNAVQRRVLDAFYSGIYSLAVTDIDFDSCPSIIGRVKEWDIKDLLEALCDADIKIFQNIPEVVGISVTSTCQFIPGCAIAELVREFRPDVKIILGGSCADLFANSSYARKTDIKKYFDYIIIGEGETALTQLLRYFKEGGNLEDIPNLMIIDSDEEIRYTNQIIEDVNTLPPPNFDGLNLELYLSPKLILPYQASRGCHYGQCAFCNHDEKYRHHYRSKPAETVVADILGLCRKYGVQHIQFVDEAIRPDCFRDIVEEMDGHEEFRDIKWFYYSRVSRQYDAELLRKAHKNGCEMVMFGIETFHQRLLNFIKKGTNAEAARYCLELFHMCGIKTYAWLLCNLPSETVEEAETDLAEVKRMRESVDAFCVGMFMLVRNTDMYDNLEKYNIISMDPCDPTKFQSHKDGVIVDGIRMRRFFEEEYVRYQKEQFSLGNRYTLFFE